MLTTLERIELLVEDIQYNLSEKVMELDDLEVQNALNIVEDQLYEINDQLLQLIDNY